MKSRAIRKPLILAKSKLTRTGDDGMTEFSWRMSKKGKSRMARDSNLEAKTEELIREHFRVYFPTRETVVASRGGPNVSLTLDPDAPILV